MFAIALSFLMMFPGQPSVMAPETHAQSIAPADSATYLKIDRVFITGNRLTRDAIILRELSFKPGDVFYSGDLPGIFDLDQKKLINTRLFNNVEIKLLPAGPNNTDVVVAVSERWYTFPSPIFELSDRNFNEWWQNYNHDFRRINYGIRLYQYNMRGRNETLRLTAQSGFIRRFELTYRFPYIDREKKHGLMIDLSFAETKNLASRTVDHKYEFIKSRDLVKINRLAAATYTFRKSFYQTHWVRLEYFNTDVEDTVRIFNENYLRGESKRQQYASISYTFNSDHRDYFAYPLRGHQLIATVARYGVLSSDNFERNELNVLYSRYWHLKGKYYLSNNFVGYLSTPENISYVNYAFLGYKKTLVRGYELYVVEGPRYFLNKTTFKRLLFSRKYRWNAMPLEQFRQIPLALYLKTYADFAYVENYPQYERDGVNTRLSDKLLSGAGAGIDVVGFYDLVLRFEYSFNGEGERGFFFHVRREF